MTTKKKKKAKKSSPGRSATTSPSSSTQTSGDNKQQIAQSTASSSPINCDLAAADIAGSDTIPFSDLLLEHNTTWQIENGAIDLDLTDNDEISSTPTKEFVVITQETSINQSALPAVVVNPELQDIGAAAPSSAKSIVAVLKNTLTPPAVKPNDEWVGLFKCKGKKLEKKGEPFTLPSGELCVQIPNSVIEKNMKVWECFVIENPYLKLSTFSLILRLVTQSNVALLLQLPVRDASPLLTYLMLAPGQRAITTRAESRSINTRRSDDMNLSMAGPLATKLNRRERHEITPLSRLTKRAKKLITTLYQRVMRSLQTRG
ncbi:BnaC09g11850D [Brassica napus]|uniref:BnaC09g11850D protein n=1 Tax=Brassica napus TaxID=3708 RepID=A0A078GGL2_BRANA|nr:BnaC09g11850D [Brassica napus]